MTSAFLIFLGLFASQFFMAIALVQTFVNSHLDWSKKVSYRYIYNLHRLLCGVIFTNISNINQIKLLLCLKSFKCIYYKVQTLPPHNTILHSLTCLCCLVSFLNTFPKNIPHSNHSSWMSCPFLNITYTLVFHMFRILGPTDHQLVSNARLPPC